FLSKSKPLLPRIIRFYLSPLEANHYCLLTHIPLSVFLEGPRRIQPSLLFSSSCRSRCYDNLLCSRCANPAQAGVPREVDIEEQVGPTREYDFSENQLAGSPHVHLCLFAKETSPAFPYLSVIR